MKKIKTAAALVAAIMLTACGSTEKGNNQALPADVTLPTSVSDVTDASIAEAADTDDEKSLPAVSTSAPTVTENRQDPPAERYSDEDDEVEHQAAYYEESFDNNEDDDSGIVNAITLTFYKMTLDVTDMVMPIVTMYPENAEDKSEIWTSSDDSVAEVDEIGYIYANGPGECIITVRSAANPDVYADVRITVRGDDDDYYEPAPAVTEAPAETPSKKVSEPTYINGILIANKTYALPADYNPGVDPEAQAAFDDMQEDAYAKGLNIYIASGFRSYDYQSQLYQRYVDRSGKEQADRYSARPGHSEHQTGLAFDLNSIDISFADTDEYEWVKRHCYEYGFIIRYPEGAEDITGYMYEPWHLRYLGRETARDVYNSGLTLEEYLGIDSKYDE